MARDGKKPTLAMFGGSLFLFPHPVKELAEFMHGHNIHINYDGAHVAGLIAGGEFQDPLREGADTMTMSSHKTLWGPQGGIIVSYEKFADGIKKGIFPGNTSSHHLHHVAGKAVALAEALEFGKDYAKQVIKNAKQLAESLVDCGFTVLGEKKAGRHYMHPSGVRIGANEITRIGMKESEMIEIANFIKRVVIDKEDT